MEAHIDLNINTSSFNGQELLHPITQVNATKCVSRKQK